MSKFRNIEGLSELKNKPIGLCCKCGGSVFDLFSGICYACKNRGDISEGDEMTERSPIMKTFDRFLSWSKERGVSEDACVITAAILTLSWTLADIFPTSFDKNHVRKSQEWLESLGERASRTDS